MQNIGDANLRQFPKCEQKLKQESQMVLQPEKIKKKQKKPCVHWTSKENLRYLAFIMSNQADLGYKSTRKIWKIYKRMSQFIKTRDIHQCRSHHQKMIKRQQNIDELIEQLKFATSEKHLEKALKQYSQLFIQNQKKKDQKTTRFQSIETKKTCRDKKLQNDQKEQKNDPLKDNLSEKKFKFLKQQPIIKQQQVQDWPRNDMNLFSRLNYSLPPIMPYQNPFYMPRSPYFFIYHR